MFLELYYCQLSLQVIIRTWALPRRLHSSSCGVWAMEQQFLSSRISVGKVVILWQKSKACVNGSNTVPGRVQTKTITEISIVSVGIRSVPFLPTGVAGSFWRGTPSIRLFLHNQAVFSPASSKCAFFFFFPAAKNIPPPCLIDKSLFLFVSIPIILSSMIQ